VSITVKDKERDSVAESDGAQQMAFKPLRDQPFIWSQLAVRPPWTQTSRS
jgi:hypothetical protein